jgi:hypothetical protein
MADDERARWIESMAADLRAALDDPDVRAEVAGLVTGEPDRRARRLEALAEELSGYELAWQRREGDSDG